MGQLRPPIPRRGYPKKLIVHSFEVPTIYTSFRRTTYINTAYIGGVVSQFSASIATDVST